MNISDPAVPLLPTVSHALVHDWLVVLRAHCSPEPLHLFLADVGLELASPAIARVTRDQIVRPYQRVAVETGDEMMGLWSRPIRPGSRVANSRSPKSGLPSRYPSSPRTTPCCSPRESSTTKLAHPSASTAQWAQ